MSIKRVGIKKHYIILLLITVASFLLRLINLSDLPTAFAPDEAVLAYSGWSILTTGKDEWGKLFPLVLRSFDDNKPAVYSYLTIPGIAVFGINRFSARLPAAFFGSLLPLVMYFLLTRLKTRKTVSLLAVFIIATSPWHIEISRTAVEAGVALCFSLIALWLISLKQEKYKLAGLILVLVSLFTYHAARLVVPAIILAAAMFKVIKVERKIVVSIIGVLILGFWLAFTQSSGRYKQISIFTDLGARLLREEAIREDAGEIPVSLLETRLVHNKPFSWVYSFADSYITNTSLSYLFLGGAQPPRVTIPETGQFLLVSLPFFLYGMVLSLRRRKPIDKFLITWLLIAPIPASLTTAELPHTYRTIFMLPPLAFYIAFGIDGFVRLVKEKVKRPVYWLTFLVLLILFAFNFFRSWHQYRVHQQVHQPWYRQYGYQELVKHLNNLESAENITISNGEGEPYIYILFYNRIHPKIYQDWNEKRLSHEDIEAGKETWQMFDYTFSESFCPHDVTETNPNYYYVVMPDCQLPKDFERIQTIYFLDGKPEFHIDRPSIQVNET